MNTLQVCINGKAIKQYPFQGKVFIEAREGTEYTLKIYNNHCLRRLAVVTVDGVNVVSGEVQGEEIGRGYIIPAYSSIEVKGFRQDLSTVGTFKFCKKGKSYCNSQGASGNNGVIGVRMYNEKAKPIYWSTKTSEPSYPSYPVYRGFDNDTVTTCYSSSIDYDSQSKGVQPRKIQKCDLSAPSACAAPDFDLGTTWGKEEKDSVTLVDFENESYVAEEAIIFYDSRKNLEAIGLSFKEEKHVNAFPKPFGGFATPPKGWKG